MPPKTVLLLQEAELGAFTRRYEHENHVRRIERGEANPSFLVLLRIARALGVRPCDLIE